MRHEDLVAHGLKPAQTSPFGCPHHSLRRDVAWDLEREGDVGRARGNDQGNRFGVDK